MAAPDDPNVVRAVIERQIEYLGEQVSRIDGEHEEIQDTLDDMRRALTDVGVTLSALDLRIRTLLDDPPRLEQHWKFGQGVFLAQWSDAAAREGAAAEGLESWLRSGGGSRRGSPCTRRRSVTRSG